MNIKVVLFLTLLFTLKAARFLGGEAECCDPNDQLSCPIGTKCVKIDDEYKCKTTILFSSTKTTQEGSNKPDNEGTPQNTQEEEIPTMKSNKLYKISSEEDD